MSTYLRDDGVWVVTEAGAATFITEDELTAHRWVVANRGDHIARLEVAFWPLGVTLDERLSIAEFARWSEDGRK